MGITTNLHLIVQNIGWERAPVTPRFLRTCSDDQQLFTKITISLLVLCIQIRWDKGENFMKIRGRKSKLENVSLTKDPNKKELDAEVI